MCLGLHVRDVLAIDVNDLATGAAVYHTRECNLSRLRGRMVAEDAPNRNSMSKISSFGASPLGKSHLRSCISLYARQEEWNADINEMEIPSGVLKSLRKITIYRL